MEKEQKEEVKSELMLFVDRVTTESDLNRIKDIFIEGFKSMKNPVEKDALNMTLFHYFLMMGDKYESKEDLAREIFQAKISRDSKSEDLVIFSKARAEKTFLPETVLHYLARRRLVKLIHIYLSLIAAIPENNRPPNFSINALNFRGETFWHILLQDKYTKQTACELLNHFSSIFPIQVDSNKKEATEEKVPSIKDVLLKEIPELLKQYYLKNELSNFSELIKILTHPNKPDIFPPISSILLLEHINSSLIHDLSKNCRVDFLNEIIENLKTAIQKEDLIRPLLFCQLLKNTKPKKNQTNALSNLELKKNSEGLLLYVCGKCSAAVINIIWQWILKEQNEMEARKIEGYPSLYDAMVFYPKEMRHRTTCLHALAENKNISIEEMCTLGNKIIEAINIDTALSLGGVIDSRGHSVLTLSLLRIYSKSTAKTSISSSNEKSEFSQISANLNSSSLIETYIQTNLIGKLSGLNCCTSPAVSIPLSGDDLYTENNSENPISPIAIAVLCNSSSLLEQCLKWNIDINTAVFGNHHVLSYALEHCDLPIIEQIIKSEKLQRFIGYPAKDSGKKQKRKEDKKEKKDKKEEQDLFMLDQAFLNVCLKVFDISQVEKFNKEEKAIPSSLKDYWDFCSVNGLKSECLALQKSYYSDSIAIKEKALLKSMSKLGPAEEMNEAKEYYNRIEIIKAACKMYEDRYGKDSIKAMPKDWVYLLWSKYEVLNNLFLLQVRYLQGSKNFTETMLSVISKAIVHCNFALIEKLQHEDEPLKSSVKSILQSISEDAKNFKALIEDIANNSLNPKKCLDTVNSKLFPSKNWLFIPEVYYVTSKQKYGKADLSEISFFDPIGRIETEAYMNEIALQLMKCGKLSELMPYLKDILSSPLFIYSLIASQPELVTAATMSQNTEGSEAKLPEEDKKPEEPIPIVEEFIYSLAAAYGKMITHYQCTLASELLQYIMSLSHKYLSESFKLLNSIFAIDSIEFKCVYVNYKKFIHKKDSPKSAESAEDNISLIKRIIKQEDIEAIRLYARFFRKLFLVLGTACNASGPLNPICGAYLSNNLNKYCGIIRLTFLRSSERSLKQNISLEEIFSSDRYLNEVSEMLSTCSLIQPFICYQLFVKKYFEEGTNHPRKLLDTTIQNLSSHILGLIFSKVYLLQPSIISKLVLNESNKEKSSKIIIAALESFENLKTLLESSSLIAGKFFFTTHYELRIKNATKKGNEKEQELRKVLNYDAGIANMINYALIDAKYGYCITTTCKMLDSQSIEMIFKRFPFLECQILSLELANPYEHATPSSYHGKKSINAQKTIEKLMMKYDKVNSFLKNKNNKVTSGDKSGYKKERAFLVSSPALELCRRGIKIEKCHFEDFFLKYSEAQQKLVANEYFICLATNKALTQELFDHFWNMKQDLSLLTGLRLTEQIPIYEFIANKEDLQLLISVLLYIEPVISPQVMKVWFNFAAKNNKKILLLQLYLLRLIILNLNSSKRNEPQGSFNKPPVIGMESRNMEFLRLYKMNLKSFMMEASSGDINTLFNGVLFPMNPKENLVKIFKKFNEGEENVPGLYNRAVGANIALFNTGKCFGDYILILQLFMKKDNYKFVELSVETLSELAALRRVGKITNDILDEVLANIKNPILEIIKISITEISKVLLLKLAEAVISLNSNHLKDLAKDLEKEITTGKKITEPLITAYAETSATMKFDDSLVSLLQNIIQACNLSLIKAKYWKKLLYRNANSSRILLLFSRFCPEYISRIILHYSILRQEEEPIKNLLSRFTPQSLFFSVPSPKDDNYLPNIHYLHINYLYPVLSCIKINNLPILKLILSVLPSKGPYYLASTTILSSELRTLTMNGGMVTPLEIAIYYKRLTIIDYLLNSGTYYLEYAKAYYQTLLKVHCLRSNNWEIFTKINKLIDNPKEVSSQFCDFVFKAIQSADCAFCKSLFDYLRSTTYLKKGDFLMDGLLTLIESKTQNNIFHAIAASKRADILFLLKESYRLDISKKTQDSAFAYSLLTENNADHMTPFGIAIAQGDILLARAFIEPILQDPKMKFSQEEEILITKNTASLNNTILILNEALSAVAEGDIKKKKISASSENLLSISGKLLDLVFSREQQASIKALINTARNNPCFSSGSCVSSRIAKKSQKIENQLYQKNKTEKKKKKLKKFIEAVEELLMMIKRQRMSDIMLLHIFRPDLFIVIAQSDSIVRSLQTAKEGAFESKSSPVIAILLELSKNHNLSPLIPVFIHAFSKKDTSTNLSSLLLRQLFTDDIFLGAIQDSMYVLLMQQFQFLFAEQIVASPNANLTEQELYQIVPRPERIFQSPFSTLSLNCLSDKTCYLKVLEMIQQLSPLADTNDLTRSKIVFRAKPIKDYLVKVACKMLEYRHFASFTLIVIYLFQYHADNLFKELLKQMNYRIFTTLLVEEHPEELFWMYNLIINNSHKLIILSSEGKDEEKSQEENKESNSQEINKSTLELALDTLENKISLIKSNKGLSCLIMMSLLWPGESLKTSKKESDTISVLQEVLKATYGVSIYLEMPFENLDYPRSIKEISLDFVQLAQAISQAYKLIRSTSQSIFVPHFSPSLLALLKTQEKVTEKEFAEELIRFLAPSNQYLVETDFGYVNYSLDNSKLLLEVAQLIVSEQKAGSLPEAIAKIMNPINYIGFIEIPDLLTKYKISAKFIISEEASLEGKAKCAITSEVTLKEKVRPKNKYIKSCEIKNKREKVQFRDAKPNQRSDFPVYAFSCEVTIFWKDFKKITM